MMRPLGLPGGVYCTAAARGGRRGPACVWGRHGAKSRARVARDRGGHEALRAASRGAGVSYNRATKLFVGRQRWVGADGAAGQTCAPRPAACRGGGGSGAAGQPRRPRGVRVAAGHNVRGGGAQWAGLLFLVPRSTRPSCYKAKGGAGSFVFLGKKAPPRPVGARGRLAPLESRGAASFQGAPLPKAGSAGAAVAAVRGARVCFPFLGCLVWIGACARGSGSLNLPSAGMRQVQQSGGGSKAPAGAGRRAARGGRAAGGARGPGNSIAGWVVGASALAGALRGARPLAG
jgi:hypothetical protein